MQENYDAIFRAAERMGLRKKKEATA